MGMYRQAFDDDKVIVMPYELLRNDAGRLLGTIEDYLRLSHFTMPPDRVNTSLSRVEMYWFPRIRGRAHRLCESPLDAPYVRDYSPSDV